MKSKFVILLVSRSFIMSLAAFMPLRGDSTPLNVSEVDSPAVENKYLYVAVPGIHTDLGHGGHGLLVFDIDDNYRFVKRIPIGGRLRADHRSGRLAGTVSYTKGISVSLATNSVYISHLETMSRIDLDTEQVVWEYEYEGGADRMAISPDGKIIYKPTVHRYLTDFATVTDIWHVVDAESGEVMKTLNTGNYGPHNTIFGLDGKKVYLGGLRINSLGVVDAKNHEVIRQIGPLGGEVRPFTINGSQTLAYINVNGLLGFEIGNIETGELMHRIDVTKEGFEAKRPQRHGVYSHGVGLTPDEREVWVVDGANLKLHIYDNSIMPPSYVESIKLRKQPGWITFSLDGKHAYAPTGEIIDVATREVVAQLTDEQGVAVKSEKMVEIHLSPDRRAVAMSDQFGIGRVVK